MIPIETKLTRFSYVLKKSDLTAEQIANIKKELTVKPFKAGSYGKFSKDNSFSVFVETPEHLGIPKYFGIEKFGRPIINRLESYAYPTFDMQYVEGTRPLYPQQRTIINKVIAGFERFRGGLLIAGCGIGKTNMAIYLACHLKLKTLFIVHKEFLMRQFINRVKEFTNIKKVGIIQQKKIEVDTPFVVGMVHSLAKIDYPDELFKDFGLIIIDEVYHMAARNFSNVFRKMTSKYMLGISAETDRPDKLFKIINWYMGPFLHIEPQKPNSMVIVKKFNYKTSNTDRIKVVINKYTKEPDRSTMITNLCYIKKRNRHIIKIIEELYDQDKHVLCLTGRIKQVNLLFKLLNRNPLINGNVGKYLGGMREADLAKSATKQIILGTFSMAEEGLDIPHLNAVMLLTPKSAVRQSVGRILRKDKYTESPLIIDFVDDNQIFKNQARTRSKYFAEQKYNIQEFYIADYELAGYKMWDDSQYIKECLLKEPEIPIGGVVVPAVQNKIQQIDFDEVDFDTDSDDSNSE